MNRIQATEQRLMFCQIAGGTPQILNFDIDNHELSEYPANLSVLRSLEDASQVYLDDSLFICGTPPDSDGIQGSFLLRFDLSALEQHHSKPKLLVNSVFAHRRPSLFALEEEKILVIGGKMTAKCEFYNLRTNRWKTIPALPEPVLGGSLIFVASANSVYLFGGKNKKGEYRNKILKINVRFFDGWEEVEIRGNFDFGRSFSGLFFSSFDQILVVGGERKGQKEAGILEFDLESGEFSRSTKILDESNELLLSCPFVNEEGAFFLDKKHQILKIYRDNDSVEKFSDLSEQK